MAGSLYTKFLEGARIFNFRSSILFASPYKRRKRRRAMPAASNSGPGVIPGNGPGSGYVRKGWIIGLCLGLFALALTLLILLFRNWPKDDCTVCTMLARPATATTA